MKLQATLAIGAAFLVLAVSAAAGKPAQLLSIRCEATQAEWKEPRVFNVSFKDNNGKIKDLKVVETDRVFTPGNIVASFSLSGGVARTSSVPNQRPGKWKAAIVGGVITLTLDAGNGGATAALKPLADKPGKFDLQWQADMTLRFAGPQTAQGAGTCMETPSK
ncbi:MAG: hypothetical protein KA233_00750 [Novosphingobium sp.]|jgi:hypothetical protein|nr:hypothetical protein [Novosphingobium sp.]MBP6554189.1 hypothetical protein [Novosphingobium sp.]